MILAGRALLQEQPPGRIEDEDGEGPVQRPFAVRPQLLAHAQLAVVLVNQNHPLRITHRLAPCKLRNPIVRAGATVNRPGTTRPEGV